MNSGSPTRGNQVPVKRFGGNILLNKLDRRQCGGLIRLLGERKDYYENKKKRERSVCGYREYHFSVDNGIIGKDLPDAAGGIEAGTVLHCLYERGIGRNTNNVGQSRS